MSTLYNNRIEEHRHNPDMAVHYLLSSTPNIHLNAEARGKAESLLRLLLNTRRPATLEHAYQVWRDEPLTRDFAEAVRATYLPEYRDEAPDPAVVEPTTALIARAGELPQIWRQVHSAINGTERYTAWFGGQPAFLQGEAGDQWRLTFLDYQSMLFPSRQIAERDAPTFALSVLNVIASNVEK